MARVVVIDDEADVRDAIELTLTAAGYSVRTAQDGPTGIAECRTEEPDLVLTDLVMPIAHGFDVIAAIRQAVPRTRIIAISGGGSVGPATYQPEAVTTNAYLAAALEMGADAILHKPFNRRELLEAVERCLALERRAPRH